MSRIGREWKSISWCYFCLIFLCITRALSEDDHNSHESTDTTPQKSRYLPARHVERENVHHVQQRHLLSSQVEQQKHKTEDEAPLQSELLASTTEAILEQQDTNTSQQQHSLGIVNGTRHIGNISLPDSGNQNQRTSDRFGENVGLANNGNNDEGHKSRTLVESNITTVREHYHLYYNSTILTVPDKAHHYYWVDLDNNRSEVIMSNEPPNHYRKAKTVKLSFDFPIYGHPIQNVTIATGGFLYTGDYIHSWLAATQYVAPLMANFDTMPNESLVRYMDNGTAFTVEWTKLSLRNQPKEEQFTFQVTLYKKGDIVFVYKELPLAVKDIDDSRHPVKIGLSDAYVTNGIMYFVRRKTIHEYHRISFVQEDIRNWTAIHLKALPTCSVHKDCSSCLLDPSVAKLNCSWCPSLERCSNGIDRGRDEWLARGCDKTHVINETECGQKNVFRKNDEHAHPKVYDASENTTTFVHHGDNNSDHSTDKNTTMPLIHNGYYENQTDSNNARGRTVESGQDVTPSNRSEENVDENDRCINDTIRDESAAPTYFTPASDKKNVIPLVHHDENNNTYIAITSNGTGEVNQNQTSNRSQEGVSRVDNVEKDKEYMNNTLDVRNTTIVKRDYHQYYNSTILKYDEAHHHYWVDLDNGADVILSNKLSNSSRKAKTVKLSFDFPIYGHLIKNVTIATGGFLFTGDFIHSWLSASQYVAPLMANFDIISNGSFVRYMDNGTAFTVEWTKLPLRNRPKEEEFTFQVTLYKNGDIVFVYKKLPLTIEDIDDPQHPVKIGLSDAYVFERTIFNTRRKTLYEYHRISFVQEDINDRTVIYLKALPTCLVHKDCSSCLLDPSTTKLNCSWCPSLERCSNGIDRGRDRWLMSGCYEAKLNNATQCSKKDVFRKDHNYDERPHAEIFDDNENSRKNTHGDVVIDGGSPDNNTAMSLIHNDSHKNNNTDNNSASDGTTGSGQNKTMNTTNV